MTSIGERKNSLVEFESDVDVHAVIRLFVRPLINFLRVFQMNEMAVEAKVHFNRGPIVEHQKKIFPFALHRLDSTTSEQRRDMRRRLRQHADRMKHLDAAN